MPETDKVRIIGFRATLGPLFNAALPLQPGLTVLYGLNGAGKTSMLHAVHAGLTGTRIDLAGNYIGPDQGVRIYVEAPQDAFDLTWNRGEPGEDWQFWHAWYPGSPTGPCADLLEGLRDQARQDHVWELDPTEGRPPGHPSWKIGPAVWLREGSPAKAVFDAEGTFHRAAVRARSHRDAGMLDEMRLLWFPRDWDSTAVGDNLEWAQDFFAGNAVLWDAEHAPISDDGLPHALSYLDFEYQRANEKKIQIHVFTEAGGPDDADRITRGMITELCKPGTDLPVSGGWVELITSEKLAFTTDAALSDDDEPPGEPIDPERDLLPIQHRPVVTLWLQHLEKLANACYARLLLDAPQLDLHIDHSAAAEFGGTRLAWWVDGMPLSALSRAQLRWANLSIRLALEATLNAPEGAPSPSPDRLTFNKHTFVLLDEPEAALHRTAERHLSAGLAWLAGQPGMHLIVATHSPHLLDLPDAHVFRVHRRPVQLTSGVRQVGVIQPLEAIHRAELSAFGLEPSDLLARSRVVLLVEGQHDELLIRELLNRNLDSRTMATIQVLALRGASQLPHALNARLLFDFTDATVVPVIDNIQMATLADAWDQALVIAAANGTDAAGERLRTMLPPGQSGEYLFMGQFLSRAIALGMQSRVEPFSFPAVDITDYLPIEGFTGKATTWAEERSRWHSDRDSGATKIGYFKTWFARRHSTDFSDERLLAAITQIPGCPDDFRLLADLCARLAQKDH